MTDYSRLIIERLRSNLGEGVSILPKYFYAQDTVKVARALLGKLLATWSNEGICAGRIVEVEAYLGDIDPACHAYGNLTARNSIFFGEPGVAYVFMIYGIHYCFNVITLPKGRAGCVLIRAAEPVVGLDLMKERRKIDSENNLTSGPGKLAQAMGITKKHNGTDLSSGQTIICTDHTVPIDVSSSCRVGITKAANWKLRFFITHSQFVS
jgi:DNA-3-methyladenine glycosylase